MRAKRPAPAAHRLGMKMGPRWNVVQSIPTLRLAGVRRPDLDRWVSTPWEKPARGRNRPAPCPGTTECRGWLVRPARGPTSAFHPAAPRPPPLLEVVMEAIVERAAGLDVHQGSVVACVTIGAAGRRASRDPRTFGAMRRDLAALRDWLHEMGVTHVGMAAAGVPWQPIHAALGAPSRLSSATPRTCATCPSSRFAAVCFAARSPEAMTQDGRRTPSGSPTWSGTGWCAPASCRRQRSGCCAS